jgi:hypothetical protein
MSIRKGIVAALAVLGSSLMVTSARGEGTCDKGFRDTTPGERATMTRVLETIQAALPAPTTGWLILGDDKVSVPQSICLDDEAAPWRYAYKRYYQRVDDQEERARAMSAAGADLAAAMAAKQPQMDAIRAKMSELGAEMGAASQKGDATRAHELSLALQKLGDEYQRLFTDDPASDRAAGVAHDASQDREMTLAVEINPSLVSPPTGSQSLVVRGAQTALRWSAIRGEVHEDNALVLLGAWEPQEHGLGFIGRSGAPPTAAHGISIRLVADTERLLPTLESIAMADIQKTLSN